MEYTSLIQSLTPPQKEQEKVARATQFVIQLIDGQAQERGIELEVLPGGSTAKGTNLAGDYDIDVFVRFKTPGDFSDMLAELLQPLDDVERIRGSRDYFAVDIEGLHVELVPVKYIEDIQNAENVTDMSPLHVLWAKKHIDKKLADDIRLAKKFCKAQHVYGAESYINGVSGHVLDILLAHYGSFDNFIKEVANWNERTIIDSNNAHENVLAELNAAKVQSPLILVDPIDGQRNAAAALSKEKYEQLIAAAKRFVESPSEEFFVVKEITIKDLQDKLKENEHLLVYKLLPLEGNKDIAFTKLLKVVEFLKRSLQQHELPFRECNWLPRKEEALVYCIAPNEPLEEIRVRRGPPVWQTDDVKRFQEANEHTYEEDGYFYVKEKRTYTSAKEALEKLLRSPYVVQRSQERKKITL